MFLNEVEFYQYYVQFSELSIAMNEKLLLAIKKNPHLNFKEAWEKIETLEKLQSVFHKMYYNQVALDNINFRVTKEFHIMNEKITRLQEENKKLKKQLEF